MKHLKMKFQMLTRTELKVCDFFYKHTIYEHRTDAKKSIPKIEIE